MRGRGCGRLSGSGPERVIHHIINQLGVRDGGAEAVVRTLHMGLCARNVPSTLMAVSEPGVQGSCPYQSLNMSSPYTLKAVPALVRYIRANCDKQDVIHSHLFPGNLFVSLAVRLTGWPGALVTTEHSTSNRRRSKWWGPAVDRLTYARYDRIFCISDGVRDALDDWMPTLRSKLEVIRNGVALSFSKMPERKPGAKPVVVSVGRLSKIKNYDTAIRAVAMLDDLDFEYCIAGGGSENAALLQLCADLDVSDKVCFLGYVNDVAALLTRADVFLIPSRWEGFGLSAVEAMNAGLPVVASNVPGLSEIVGVDCGPTVDPDSPASVAEGLRGMLTDPDWRLACGRNAFTRSQQFSADEMVENYLCRYRDLGLAEA